MSHSFTEALAGGNGAIGKAGLIAGTTTTFSVGAFNYLIEGRQYSKAAATNQAMPTLDGATNKAFVPVKPREACNFTFGIDRAGAVAVWQGERVNVGEPTDFPAIPFTHAVFGFLRVDVGAGSANTFVLGTSNTSGVAGVTYSFRDVSGQAARPAKAVA